MCAGDIHLLIMQAMRVKKTRSCCAKQRLVDIKQESNTSNALVILNATSDLTLENYDSISCDILDVINAVTSRWMTCDLQQTACLVVNPFGVGNFAFLFNCTPVGRTSDFITVPT